MINQQEETEREKLKQDGETKRAEIQISIEQMQLNQGRLKVSFLSNKLIFEEI